MQSKPTCPPCTRTSGFTLVEVLAAMLFLAILVPVAVQALTLAHRSSVIATRSATAVQLGENLLAELLLDDAWMGAAPAGDFGTGRSPFRWELHQGTWAQDSLVELTLDVAFDVQGREYSVRLTTLAAEETLE